MTMLSRRGSISILANAEIDDGDKLIKTEEDDEEFSTFRCIGSVAVSILDETESTTKYPKNSEEGRQSFKKSRRVVKILRELGQKSRLLPKRFRINAVAEYQEMAENENESKSIVSIRSSRDNLGTGRSMLVKQNAQVVSRPSASQGAWDKSQLHSSDSTSYRNLMIRQKSLILDDSSLGGMSDITEDTFFGGSKMDRLSFRRTPMFINSNTYCIDEDEDESQSNSEEKDSSSASEGITERAYDFRKLSPLNDNMDSAREYNLSMTIHNPLETEKEFPQFPVDGIRRRSFSDSDIDFERRGQISNENSPNNDLFPPTPSLRKLLPLKESMDSAREYNLSMTIHNPLETEKGFSQFPVDDRVRRRSFSDSHINFEHREEISKENSPTNYFIPLTPSFRKRSPSNYGMDSAREYNLNMTIHNPLETEKEFSQFPADDCVRMRSFSASDINFDRRGQNSQTNDLFPLTTSSIFSKKDQFQYTCSLDQTKASSHDRSLNCPRQNSGSFDKDVEGKAQQNSCLSGSSHHAAADSWPFPRTRSYSEPCLRQAPINDGLRGPSGEDSIEKTKIKNCSLLDNETGSSLSRSKIRNGSSSDASLKTPFSRQQSLPLFESEEQKNLPKLISRAYSESITHEKSGQDQLEILWIPRKNTILDVKACAAASPKPKEETFEAFESAELSLESQAHRPASALFAGDRKSTSTKTMDRKTGHPRPPASSVLAMLSSSNNRLVGTLIATEIGMPLQDPSVRNPSPRTLNAATTIAAALRPAPVQSPPALPTAAQIECEKYYWGSTVGDVALSENSNGKDWEKDEIDLKTLCSWSSASYDDIL